MTCCTVSWFLRLCMRFCFLFSFIRLIRSKTEPLTSINKEIFSMEALWGKIAYLYVFGGEGRDGGFHLGPDTLQWVQPLTMAKQNVSRTYRGFYPSILYHGLFCTLLSERNQITTDSINGREAAPHTELHPQREQLFKQSTITSKTHCWTAERC